MADTPNPQSDAADFGDGGFSQDDIDALLAGGGAEAASPTSSPDGAAESTESSSGFDQGDIDALMTAAGDETEEVDTRLDSQGRPFDESAALMQAAIEEERAAKAAQQAAAASAAPAAALNTKSVDYEELARAGDGGSHRISMLSDVDLNVRIELGRARMLVEDVLQLDSGSVVELDKLAGDPVDVYVNDRLVARGEVLVLNDNFCVRICDVMSRDPHRVIS